MPLRAGGGTRVKILDNLAMAKPIVSTSIGIEGIGVVPDRDLLVADTPITFAAAISRIIEDPGLRQSLANNARAIAEQLYSWERIVDALNDSYDCAAASTC